MVIERSRGEVITFINRKSEDFIYQNEDFCKCLFYNAIGNWVRVLVSYE